MFIVGIHRFPVLTKTAVGNAGIVFQTAVIASYQIYVEAVQFIVSATGGGKSDLTLVQGMSDLDTSLCSFCCNGRVPRNLLQKSW